jgi:hypothetical protein
MDTKKKESTTGNLARRLMARLLSLMAVGVCQRGRLRRPGHADCPYMA